MKMDYQAMLDELANMRPDLKEEVLALQEQLGEEELSELDAAPEDEEEAPIMPGRPDKKGKRIPAELMDEDEEEGMEMDVAPALMVRKRPRGK